MLVTMNRRMETPPTRLARATTTPSSSSNNDIEKVGFFAPKPLKRPRLPRPNHEMKYISWNHMGTSVIVNDQYDNPNRNTKSDVNVCILMHHNNEKKASSCKSQKQYPDKPKLTVGCDQYNELVKENPPPTDDRKAKSKKEEEKHFHHHHHNTANNVQEVVKQPHYILPNHRQLTMKSSSSVVYHKYDTIIPSRRNEIRPPSSSSSSTSSIYFIRPQNDFIRTSVKRPSDF